MNLIFLWKEMIKKELTDIMTKNEIKHILVQNDWYWMHEMTYLPNFTWSHYLLFIILNCTWGILVPVWSGHRMEDFYIISTISYSAWILEAYLSCDESKFYVIVSKWI